MWQLIDNPTKNPKWAGTWIKWYGIRRCGAYEDGQAHASVLEAYIGAADAHRILVLVSQGHKGGLL